MDRRRLADRKFLALVVVTLLAAVGLVVVPSGGPYPVFRYLLTGGGHILIVLIAAWIGFERARYFTFGSGLGRSLLYMSAGMLSSGLGSLVWAYYNIVLKVEVPYPSIGDTFYLLAYLLGGYSLLVLLRSLEVRLDAVRRLKLVMLPLAVFSAVYLLFVQSGLAENVPLLEKAFNVLYPVGDAILLSLALLILDFSRGSAVSRPVSIISAGFVLLALADFSFSWAASAGSYSTGNWIDLLFSAAYFVVGAGMYFMSGSYFMKRLSGAE